VPFTGSHPLAVLPLVHYRRRLRLDATALVVAAMAPDLQYFARGYMSGDKLGHEWIGLLLWCLPITLAVAFVWHAVVKWPLVMIAPRTLAARLVPHAAHRWPAPPGLRAPTAIGLSVCVSAILGAVTHLLWDACTHADGFVVVRVPALSSKLAGLEVHRILQLGCSVVGLVGLAIYVWRTLARTRPVAIASTPRAGARIAFALAILACIPPFVARLYVIGKLRGGDLLVAPSTGALVGIVLASLALRSRARRFAAREMLEVRA
jgi:hypothetical protein